MDINPIFNSHAICRFHGVHVTESNKYELHFIDHQLISKSKTAIGESVATALVRSFSLITFNKDECVLSACDLFDLRQLARYLAEEILSCSSAAKRAEVALSYLAITCYLAYNTLSHVYFLAFLGGVKFTYVVLTTRCI